MKKFQHHLSQQQQQVPPRMSHNSRPWSLQLTTTTLTIQTNKGESDPSADVPYWIRKSRLSIETFKRLKRSIRKKRKKGKISLMCSLSPLPPINQYFGLEERRRRRRTLIGIEWSLMVHNKSEWMCCNLQARIKFSFSFFSISTARRKHQVECSRTLLAKCPAGCHRACRPCRCQRCQCRPCPCRTCRRSQACERPIRPRKVQRAMAPRSRLLKRSQRPHTRRTTTTAPGEFR